MCYIMFGRGTRQARGSKVSAADVPSLVRGIRVARGLTQEAVACEMGVTFRTVNGWENGRHRPIPALVTRLLDIANAAGLTMEGGRRASRPTRVPPRLER